MNAIIALFWTKSSKAGVAVLWCLASLFLLNQAGCHTSSCCDSQASRSSANVEYHWNCGLNVAYITLRLFHRDVNLYKLADEIGAGVYFERDVSLLALKKAFEEYGLIAEGFTADYPEEIMGFAKPDNILVVYVDCCCGNQKLGHFIVVKGFQDHVLVIDPPYHPKRFTRQNIIEKGPLFAATGEFLVVYEPEVPSPHTNEESK